MKGRWGDVMGEGGVRGPGDLRSGEGSACGTRTVSQLLLLNRPLAGHVFSPTSPSPDRINSLTSPHGSLLNGLFSTPFPSSRTLV